MTMQFTVVGDVQVIARLEAVGERLDREVRAGIGRAALMLEREVKQSWLSGKVLHVRSGRLRRSITSRVDDRDGEVTGIVGTNVEYARPHEYGFKGVVTVREHLRRTKLGNQAVVRSHSRKVDLPERSFLRAALRDKRGEILDTMQAAVNRAVRGP